jgi:hypothetical protein
VAKKTKVERPAYIIKVDRNCAMVQELDSGYPNWHERPQHDEGGYWSSACKGGLAYSECVAGYQ